MKTILVLTIATLCSASIHSQTMQGKKILTSTLTAANLGLLTTEAESSTEPTVKYKSTSFALSPEFTFGKVNSKNVLVSYGLALGYGHSSYKSTGNPKSTSSTYSAGPVFLVQKFITVTDRIYYTPLLRVAGTYGWAHSDPESDAKTTTLDSRASIRPLSVTFNIKPKSNVILMIGDFGAYFTSNKTELQPDVSTNKFRAGGLYATLNSFSVGYQWIL